MQNCPPFLISSVTVRITTTYWRLSQKHQSLHRHYQNVYCHFRQWATLSCIKIQVFGWGASEWHPCQMDCPSPWILFPPDPFLCCPSSPTASSSPQPVLTPNPADFFGSGTVHTSWKKRYSPQQLEKQATTNRRTETSCYSKV